MTFTAEQTRLMDGDLDTKHVKTRDGLSYIEGWHAIAEANRIFGHEWSSETVMLTCVADKPRKMGPVPRKPGDKPQRDGHGISYIARVRVTVGNVVREGTGAGHGINGDLGLAHESAIKEAETDARKRALMTFGNKFGLALYDKTRANVSHGADDADNQHEPAPVVTASAKADSQEQHDPVTGELPTLHKAIPPLSPIEQDSIPFEHPHTPVISKEEDSAGRRYELMALLRNVSQNPGDKYHRDMFTGKLEVHRASMTEADLAAVDDERNQVRAMIATVAAAQEAKNNPPKSRPRQRRPQTVGAMA